MCVVGQQKLWEEEGLYIMLTSSVYALDAIVVIIRQFR